jgi:hypothetical protein
MFSENENLVLMPLTADESTSIKEKASLFNKMSLELLDQYEILYDESSQLRQLYEEYKEEICSKPLVKMDQDLKIFESKNGQIN